ncbi:hypothetical protein DSM104299_04156 [Baekduia alba]|uniref:hypothetical protein n=1 Tax=Baekduia alba TaxID=2997333 RepID=UPI0023411055|nr:hypothetical protein [Baekduia alba]WCB95413.1 hypothetical protein DSM104299_04156 [Baekduia alba]
MTGREEDEDDVEMRVCVHITFSNLEGGDDQLTQHSVTFETNLEGRSLDELYEIALMVAKDTFWHEFTVSLGITVTYIPQVHAQHT